MSALLTVAGFARRIASSERHVRTLIAKGLLPVVDIGAAQSRRTIRIHPDALKLRRSRTERTTP
jgi:hypothetical protein